MSLSHELYWAAGFLDGEGNIRFRICKRNVGRTRDHGTFYISAAQVNREPLERLQNVLGGTVYGPYGPYNTTKQPHYQWGIGGHKAVASYSLFREFLCSVKRAQGDQALAEWNAQQARPKLLKGRARHQELQQLLSI